MSGALHDLLGTLVPLDAARMLRALRGRRSDRERGGSLALALRGDRSLTSAPHVQRIAVRRQSARRGSCPSQACEQRGDS